MSFFYKCLAIWYYGIGVNFWTLAKGGLNLNNSYDDTNLKNRCFVLSL